MLLFYRLCPTKQQQCNLFLKFPSSFNVDKGIAKTFMLRSLCVIVYMVTFLNTVVSSLSHSLCSSTPSLFSLSVKLGPFSQAHFLENLNMWMVLSSVYSGMAFLPDVNQTFSASRHCCLAILHLHPMYHKDPMSHTAVYSFPIFQICSTHLNERYHPELLLVQI